MKVSVIASLIVGIHVVVVASVAMQGCTATRGPRTDIEDTTVAPPPAFQTRQAKSVQLEPSGSQRFCCNMALLTLFSSLWVRSVRFETMPLT